jgi:DNA-binding FadR family transcriptional regulator
MKNQQHRARTTGRRSKATHAQPRSEAAPIIEIRAPKLSHLVAERLRGRIASGELKSGDTLPPEAELLRQFDVSRPIMREALRVLEAEELIKLGRGTRAGAKVLTPSIETASKYGGLYLATQGTTLGEIHEVRTLIEPSLVSLLARRPRKDFLPDLADCVRRQRSAVDTGNYTEAIIEITNFHDRMVAASENQALRLLAGMLHNFSVKVYPRLLASRQNQKTVQRRTEESVAAHAKVLGLITDGQPDKAETFWRQYMQDTADFLSRNGLSDLLLEAPRLSLMAG